RYHNIITMPLSDRIKPRQAAPKLRTYLTYSLNKEFPVFTSVIPLINLCNRNAKILPTRYDRVRIRIGHVNPGFSSALVFGLSSRQGDLITPSERDNEDDGCSEHQVRHQFVRHGTPSYRASPFVSPKVF